MKYILNYQYLPIGVARPQDDGMTVRVEVDEKGFALLPNVGDFVHLDNSMNDMASFSGRVRSRRFSYIQDKEFLASCGINIVVEEADDDLRMLTKE